MQRSQFAGDGTIERDTENQQAAEQGAHIWDFLEEDQGENDPVDGFEAGNQAGGVGFHVLQAIDIQRVRQRCEHDAQQNQQEDVSGCESGALDKQEWQQHQRGDCILIQSNESV